MYIVKVRSRHRNDFYADLGCEHCGESEANAPCYEDENFHQNVMPKFWCKGCGMNRAGETKALTPAEIAADDRARELREKAKDRVREY